MELMFRAVSGSGNDAGGFDIVVPLVAAITTGYLLYIARGVNINDELKEAQNTAGSVIVDVRGADEYAKGHIPGAVNVPSNNINTIQSIVPNKDTPLFTYCQSGLRSRRAVKTLGTMDIHML